MDDRILAELGEESLTEVTGGSAMPETPALTADGHEKGTDWRDARGHLYRVNRGDSLAAIGQKFGVNWRMIVMCNPQIKNPNLIYVGDVIKLPV